MIPEILEALREQEGFRALEKLAGNVVKEEFHKGVQFGIQLAVAIMEEASRPPVQADVCQCKGTRSFTDGVCNICGLKMPPAQAEGDKPGEPEDFEYQGGLLNYKGV